MSVIYYLECSECGESLDWKASLDNDYDLTVTAEPCKTCLAEAKLEGRNGEDK